MLIKILRELKFVFVIFLFVKMKGRGFKSYVNLRIFVKKVGVEILVWK